MITNTLSEIIGAGLTPIGVLEDGNTIGLSHEDRLGITCLFGRSGQGKSVVLEQMIINDILQGRGGLFIDPYGDIIHRIQSCIPINKAQNLLSFEASFSTLGENIAQFDSGKYCEKVNTEGKFVLCKLDYRALGVRVAGELGSHIINTYLQQVQRTNCTLCIDEAHNFIDEANLKQITNRPREDISIIISNPTIMDFRNDIIKGLLATSNTILSFFVDPETANLIHEHHPLLGAEEIKSLEKFQFLAEIGAKSSTPTVAKLSNIYPSPFPKV